MDSTFVFTLRMFDQNCLQMKFEIEKFKFSFKKEHKAKFQHSSLLPCGVTDTLTDDETFAVVGRHERRCSTWVKSRRGGGVRSVRWSSWVHSEEHVC